MYKRTELATYKHTELAALEAQHCTKARLTLNDVRCSP